MAAKDRKQDPSPSSSERKDRLAAALRANIRRRKLQARRRADAGETPPEDRSPIQRPSDPKGS